MDTGNPVHDSASGDPQSPAKHGTTKCSICSACCVGGAFLVSAEASVPASLGTEMQFPALAVHPPWTDIAALERPPRTFLA
jgi:hypothetical protein